jgi:hypothetical protein
LRYRIRLDSQCLLDIFKVALAHRVLRYTTNVTYGKVKVILIQGILAWVVHCYQ